MELRFIFLAVLFIVTHIYSLRGIYNLFDKPYTRPLRRLAVGAHKVINILLIVFVFAFIVVVLNTQVDVYVTYRRFFLLIGAFMLVLIPKSALAIFTLLDDVKRAFVWLLAKVIAPSPLLSKLKNNVLILLVGYVVSGFLFFHTLWGIVYGRFDFEVVEQEVWFENLPESFNGFRIVHISDTHLGSFIRTEPVYEGLEIINSINPDMVVMTGDMVNNHAREAVKFIEAFQILNPPKGMFAVLGNHDLGDYRTWGTIEKPEPDIDSLLLVQRQMGFTTLLNEHRFVRIGSDSIMIAGVKNWGKPPFKQYGDLGAALGGRADFPFIILLTHDTSHWRAEVVPGPQISLTLSGHTHGLQFGFSNRWFHWSPIQWKYPEWNGLYSEGAEYLYVNRGFGFLSFPGRAGMPPEITVLTLKRGQNPNTLP
ncbi:MAG TPA: metallophosphoesterase [Bacteroidales bacterium]|nr:metallophosphoesterase [Bacteroidales bacterium]